MWTELSTALAQVIDAVVDASSPALVVTGAEIELPIEVTAATRRGELVFFGAAPHSRWVSGVLPPVHLARLCVAATEVEARCGR